MYKNILLPIVPDQPESVQKAFDIARHLTDKDAKFTVLHVIEEIPGYVLGQISKDVLQERRAETKRTVEELAGQLPGATVHLVSGHAGQTIVNFADKHGIDCIILSSHVPGIEDFFIGSTANRVVHHAKCAVHVIR